MRAWSCIESMKIQTARVFYQAGFLSYPSTAPIIAPRSQKCRSLNLLAFQVFPLTSSYNFQFFYLPAINRPGIANAVDPFLSWISSTSFSCIVGIAKIDLVARMR